MAVASVFYPDSGFTAAMFLGCSKPVRDDIAGRIRSAENSTSHPLLILGFLAEIERQRHIDLVEGQVCQLLGRLHALSKPEEISTTSTMRGDHYSLESWVRISELRSELETWKVQLSRMVEHVDELERDVFTDEHCSGSSSRLRSGSSGTAVEVHILDEYAEKTHGPATSAFEEANWKQHGRHAGRRIKRRLAEIIHEYDQNIRRCTIFIDGLILATQMVVSDSLRRTVRHELTPEPQSWNQIGYQDTQTNLRIANDTNKAGLKPHEIYSNAYDDLPASDFCISKYLRYTSQYLGLALCILPTTHILTI